MSLTGLDRHDAPNPSEKVVAVEVSQGVDENQTETSSVEDTVLRTTREDARDMSRMGKQQQLVRNFRFLSVAALAAIATGSWEIAPFVLTPALLNGGTPGLLYSTLWSFVCFAPIYLSLAEMASMAPIAGSQYHWVSEFAPDSIQRVLSYLTGWLSTMAYQAGNILGCFLVGSLIQVLISIAKPDYDFPAWHATLLVIAAVFIAFTGTVIGNRVLASWQSYVFILHILGYLAFVIPIWVKAPKASHQQVWSGWNNEGGWSSMPLAVLAGQLTGISAQTGVDTAAHMSEDTKHASRTIPKAMLAIYVLNFALVFHQIITLAYHMPSVDDALTDPSTYPAIYVLRQTMSPGALIGLLAVMIFLLIAGNISYLAATMRDLFAFARDKGFPFSNWVSSVNTRLHVPVNSGIVSSCIAIALSLIYLGSPVAFYAITSLNTVAILSCYGLSIACCLWRRVYRPETMPPAYFSLGKWGIPLNAAAVIFSVWAFFWCFWPTATPVDASGFNWASAIYIATMLGSLAYFFISARRHYLGPVTEIESRKIHA